MWLQAICVPLTPRHCTNEAPAAGARARCLSPALAFASGAILYLDFNPHRVRRRLVEDDRGAYQPLELSYHTTGRTVAPLAMAGAGLTS